MQPIALADLVIYGELDERVRRNAARLDGKEFQPAHVFRPADYDWPGDMEGRTILALTLLAQTTHREPAYLDRIMDELPGRFNARGYLGRMLPADQFDEQQFSGHSWLLRGLCEYYEWRRDSRVLDWVARIVEHLLLPARGYYRTYPVDPAQRARHGAAAGSLDGQLSGHWYTSTDIGCAFIALDGASHAQRLLGWPTLGELLEEMIACYAGIDLLALSFQTHATLSALRGVLRNYELTGRAELLDLARRVYMLYRSEAMTENYANYNWFGRPSWTEPCAIVDALMVATELWRHTGEQDYLDDAQLIYFNALGYGQRPNGGFGCDICSGANEPFVAPRPDIFEAWWCCTMRGGEGLARAASYTYWLEPDRITLPIWSNSLARLSRADGELLLAQRTGYPLEGWVSLEVIHSTCSLPQRLKLCLPSWVPTAELELALDGRPVGPAMGDGALDVLIEPRAHTRLDLSWPMVPRVVDTFNRHSLPGQHGFRHGPLVLGVRHTGEPIRMARSAELLPLGGARYRVEGSEGVLAPINDLYTFTSDEALSDRRQILFAD